MNKNLLILPAMVFTMGLASCAKTISREDALKFVDANYKNTQPKKISSGKVKWDFSKSKGETILLLAKEMIRKATEGLSSDLSGSLDVEASYLDSQYPLNGDNFSSTFQSSIDYKFVLKGKELTVSFENSATEYEIAASQKIENTYNSDGYPYFMKVTSSVTLDKDNVLNGYVQNTFNY